MITRSREMVELTEEEPVLTPTYAGRWVTQGVPKYKLAEQSMNPGQAYQLIHDELNLDGIPSLNLATFVTTWMEPEAQKLLIETADKNYIDQFEYQQTKQIQDRIIHILADLFNAPRQNYPIGTATIGSSEAIMLTLLAHKWRWKLFRQKRDWDTRCPNIVFGADAHTCWDKFALYFDVERRRIPLSPDSFILDMQAVKNAVDENTIAVGAIVGTTYTGQIDPVGRINEFLTEYNQYHGTDIPIHVDAASGGFVLPFTQPEFEWDFRLKWVRSINVSNHKYGLVYPGMGSVVFKDKAYLPQELIFRINYLGDEMDNYSLNFSKAAAPILLQYYSFLRLGHSGYRQIMKRIMENTAYLRRKLLALDLFDCLNPPQLPVIALRVKDPRVTAPQLARELRRFGWIVPAYPLPPAADQITVLRIVVKENFSRDMADLLLKDIKKSYAELIKG